MNHALLRIPGSHPTVWETDMVARIRQRVAKHADGSRAEALLLLLIQTKIDGTAAKLALLAGRTPDLWKTDLRAATDHLIADREFNRLFHLIRAAL